MPDFSKSPTYVQDSGIQMVKIGSGAKLLETELNEMQDIQRYRLKNFIRTELGDGIYDASGIAYTGGTFTISNTDALVDGELIHISTLSVSAVNGDTIYVDVHDSEYTYSNTLKKYGNEQGAQIMSNNMFDTRIGMETSRRTVMTYTLSKSNGDNTHRYMKLGTISGGAFNITVPIIPQISTIRAHIGSTDVHVSKDGLLQIGLNAEMLGGKKVADISLITDYVRQPGYGPDTGVANAYVVTLNPPAKAYADGMGVITKVKNTNTGPSTVNVDGLGAVPIKKGNGNDPAPGTLNGIISLRFNATTGNFQLQGEGGEYGTATQAEVLSGYTIGTDDGIISGTLSLTGSGVAADVLSGKTFYNTNAKTKVTGTMINKSGSNTIITPSTTDQTISKGYYDGTSTSGKVKGDVNLASGNIKSGVTIFGITGAVNVVDTTEATSPEGAGDILIGKVGFVNGAKVTGTMANNGTVTITPGTTDQVLPSGYYGLSRVIGDADLVSANIKAGANIFGVAGATNVIDTAEVTSPVTAGDIMTGHIGFVNGTKITGTMSDNGAVTVTPGTVDQTIAGGYHNGSGKVIGDADLVSGNIKSGATIFGVAGATNVVDTTETTNPVTASYIRSGKIGFVNGAKVTGTLAVQSTVAQTITPGTANIVKGAGIYDGTITISGDADLVSANIKAGATIFGVTGATNVVDTTEATTPMVAGDVLTGHVGFVNGAKITGTMANNGAITITPGIADQTIAGGYHSGLGKVVGDADLVSANIKAGATIFGVTGATNVVDTTEATTPMVAGDVLTGHVGFVNGAKITGTIPSKSAQTYTPGTANQTIASGQYLSGTQTIAGDVDLVAGNIKTGANIFGVAGTFTSDANAVAGDILSTKTAYVNGVKITGTIPSKSAATITPSTANQTIASGQYIGGAQTIVGDVNLVAGNIRKSKSIFGVTGSINRVTFGATKPTDPIDYDIHVDDTKNPAAVTQYYNAVWNLKIYTTALPPIIMDGTTRGYGFSKQYTQSGTGETHQSTAISNDYGTNINLGASGGYLDNDVTYTNKTYGSVFWATTALIDVTPYTKLAIDYMISSVTGSPDFYCGLASVSNDGSMVAAYTDTVAGVRKTVNYDISTFRGSYYIKVGWSAYGTEVGSASIYSVKLLL